MSASPLVVRQEGSTVVASFPGDWLRLAEGAPRRAADVLAERGGARFAVNGPMFDARGPQFLFRDVAAGISHGSHEPDQGVSVWVEGGRAHAAYGTSSIPAGAAVAVQGWPSLVVDGRVSATNVGTNSQRDTRAGIGVTADGRILIVTMVGTMVQLAERLVAAGAVAAGYLDGGSSLQVRGGGANSDSPRVAAVPLWILAEPPAATASSKRRLAAGVVATAGVLALGILLWKTREAQSRELAPLKS